MIAETRERVEELSSSIEPADADTTLLLYFTNILDHAERTQAVAGRLAYRQTEVESETDEKTP